MESGVHDPKVRTVRVTKKIEVSYRVSGATV